jgi:hypothetical protein
LHIKKVLRFRHRDKRRQTQTVSSAIPRLVSGWTPCHALRGNADSESGRVPRARSNPRRRSPRG